MKEASNNPVTLAAVKLLPRVNPAITCINITGRTINKEYTHMAVAIFTGCCEDGVVFEEIHDVIDFKNVIIDRNHFAPPVIFCTKRLPRVRTPEVRGWKTPGNKIAAEPVPATVGWPCGWVNNPIKSIEWITPS